MNWLNRVLNRDSRRLERKQKPQLVAFFWDGGEPVAHVVRDISPTGFYLVTSERWLLGTLIMMTLQRTKDSSAIPGCTVIVLSRVIRHGADGVGFEFVPTETPGHGQQMAPGCNAADRKTLDRFLHLLSFDRD